MFISFCKGMIKKWSLFKVYSVGIYGTKKTHLLMLVTSDCKLVSYHTLLTKSDMSHFIQTQKSNIEGIILSIQDNLDKSCKTTITPSHFVIPCHSHLASCVKPVPSLHLSASLKNQPHIPKITTCLFGAGVVFSR